MAFQSILNRIKYFCSHSVTPSELLPGDHLYVWRNVKHVFMYQHHGIYIGNNKCIHFTTREGGNPQVDNDLEVEQNKKEENVKDSTLKYNRKTSQYEVVENKHSLSQPQQNSFWSRFDLSRKSNKALILETSLEYFTYGGKLKRARYSVNLLEYFLKSGGTCYREERIEGQKTVEEAKKYVNQVKEGKKEVYSIASNNCEHLVLKWTTGNPKSKQLYRLTRRGILTGIFFFPLWKANDNLVLEALDKYTQLTVIYEHALSFWVYFATFIL